MADGLLELGTDHWQCVGLWNGNTFQPVPCLRYSDLLSEIYSCLGKASAVIPRLCHPTQTAEEIYTVLPWVPAPSCIAMEPLGVDGTSRNDDALFVNARAEWHLVPGGILKLLEEWQQERG